MFDSSSKSGNTNRALVALTLSDGSVSNVSVRLPLSNKIADALNNADQFLDVVTMDGDQMFISKAEVRSARLVDVPKVSQLNFYRRASDRATFDPYAVLKLEKGASAEEIKQAYHKMTRTYHPDRLSGYELPDEIHEYARVMQVRINLAYEQIGN
jgi:DnaJ-domain-containing protein 1